MPKCLLVSGYETYWEEETFFAREINKILRKMPKKPHMEFTEKEGSPFNFFNATPLVFSKQN